MNYHIICRKKNNIWLVLHSALMAAAASMDMGIPDLHLLPLQEREALSAMPSLVWNVYGSVNWLSFSILWLSFYAFTSRKKESTINYIRFLFSFALSLIFWMAQGFAMEDDLGVLFSTPAQILKSIVYILGMALLNYCIIGMVYFLLEKYNIINEYKNGGIIKYWIVLFVGWLPHILINYPGTVAADTAVELIYFFDGNIWDASHPLFHIWFTGWIFRIGGVINGSFAIFLYVIVQSLFFSFVLSYMLGLFKELRVPKWLFYGSICIFLLVPYYTNYVTVVLKDSIYSYFFLLFMIELVYLMKERNLFFDSIKHVLLFGVSIMGTLLFRINGKFIVIPTIFVLLISEIVHFRQNLKSLKKLFILMLPVVLSGVVYMGLFYSYGAQKVSSRDYLSLPLQQTARCVLYKGQLITDYERETIDSVVEYERLAEDYNPRVSDPLKRLIKDDASDDEIKDFLKVWLKMGIKYPGTYIAAAMNQNYYMFYPGVPNNVAGTSIDGSGGVISMNSSSEVMEILRDIGFDAHEPKALEIPKAVLFIWYQFLFFAPVLGLVSHPAIYILMFILLLVSAIKNKQINFIVVGIPILINFLGIFFGPAIQRHPRYLFPVIFSVPLLIAYWMYSRRAENQVK